MKVGLIHIDGKLPNLVLMKLSKYYKNNGDLVKLFLYKDIDKKLFWQGYDKIYISSIFEENKEKSKKIYNRLKWFSDVEIGGYFINPKKKLSDEIEHIMPDYDLYKNTELYDNSYSMGFTTRGCIRKCQFCIVPKKEGMIKVNCDIYEFWNRRHKHLVLLDNNIFALPSHFKKISKQIISEDLSVDFNQGLDIRLLNEEKAKLLSQLNIKPEPRFAFDSMDVEKYVVKGIELLKKYDIKRALWYVLVGFNTTWEEDMYRIELLKKLKQRPYVMRHKNVKGNTKYSLLASWVNQYQFFCTMSYDRFLECSKDRNKLDDWKSGGWNV